MATPKGKPVGYAQHILVIDCETTGLCFNSKSPVFDPKTGERHQAVSWGVIVADANTLVPVEKLYVEVKWNEESKKQKAKTPVFGKRATEIHGLSQSFLEENGVSEEAAVMLIGGLILKYWGPTVSIKTMGHNVHLFDLPFLTDLFDRQGIELRVGSRHYDSNSAGFATFGTWNSDDLFKLIGFDNRGDHNALEDAYMALEVFRTIRLLSKRILED